MDEILWELREHSAGLNCGRWDYIFSFIKKFRNRPGLRAARPGEVTMDQHFLRVLCGTADSDLPPPRHPRHGRHGGADSRSRTIRRPTSGAGRVRQDKLREVWAGHDGTWVAHPGLVPIAKAVFDTYMTESQPDRPAAGPMCASPRRSAGGHRRRDHRRGSGAGTSMSACNISSHGCAATAAFRSTT